jgi:hypothetical protein
LEYFQAFAKRRKLNEHAMIVQAMIEDVRP